MAIPSTTVFFEAHILLTVIDEVTILVLAGALVELFISAPSSIEKDEVFFFVCLWVEYDCFM